LAVEAEEALGLAVDAAVEAEEGFIIILMPFYLQDLIQ
jgi:hypothetical protein